MVRQLLSCERNICLMVDALFDSNSYVAAKKLMEVAALKQETTMTNLANIETPGYQRKQVATDFETSFRRALANGELNAISSLKPTIEADPTASPVRRDGNTVSLENELLAMSRLQLEHQFLADRISGSLNKLRMAITGKS